MNVGGNYCVQCGGIKNLWFKVEMFTKEDVEQGKAQPSSVSKEPFPICHGHPEPAPKHDGNLDEFGSAQAQLKNGSVFVKDIVDEIELTPSEALSLLNWLKQKEEEIQKLVVEEEKKQS